MLRVDMQRALLEPSGELAEVKRKLSIAEYSPVKLDPPARLHVSSQSEDRADLEQ